MSDLDREFLDRAGLTAKSVAELLGKTRQAVSKGIAGKRDYFVSQDLEQLTDALEKADPGKKAVFQAAVLDMFDMLAERVAGGARGADVVAAIERAERVWLIFPRFTASYEAQKRAYDTILDAIDARSPARSARSGAKGPELEVTVYCDRNRAPIERKFDTSWFENQQAYFIECDIVDKMSPTIIVDQHREGRSSCFTLVLQGFCGIEPREAEALISAFGSHVTDKIRENDPGRPGRPIDAQQATVAEFSSARVQKI